MIRMLLTNYQLLFCATGGQTCGALHDSSHSPVETTAACDITTAHTPVAGDFTVIGHSSNCSWPSFESETQVHTFNSNFRANTLNSFVSFHSNVALLACRISEKFVI